VVLISRGLDGFRRYAVFRDQSPLFGLQPNSFAAF
jgi:hypothetical protein